MRVAVLQDMNVDVALADSFVGRPENCILPVMKERRALFGEYAAEVCDLSLDFVLVTQFLLLQGGLKV